ncbi:hypothetical protein [Lysinibacillus odysseyi]|uniref:hypothetical protein n=1 Tax=Lysinibacillus odysseyi TaxID=202611 RepID=UPI000A4E34C2|nr:hypothetical protein [Lysinibacillus odysseyi]
MNPMYAVGLLFSFIIFILGMLFSPDIPVLYFIGIIGLAATAYCVTRIISDLYRSLHQ